MPATNRTDARDPANYTVSGTGAIKCLDCGRTGHDKASTELTHARNCGLSGAAGKIVGPRAAGEVDPVASLPIEGTVEIAGDTFNCKDSIRAAGGRWNATAKTWTVPAAAAATLLRRFPGLRVAGLASINSAARAVTEGRAYAAGLDDADLQNLVSAGIVSMSAAMNQDF